MGKRQKKNEQGLVCEYVIQSQALKRLQVSLSMFRRLCIIHGIHPRDPTKKTEGKNRTYYSLSDIRKIEVGCVRDAFCDKSAARKKLGILKARGFSKKASRVAKSLDCLVDVTGSLKDRYPTFEDAIADMSDAVSTLALLAALPADRAIGISPRLIACASAAYHDFLNCVMDGKRLTKCFASIKGFYFTADFGSGHKKVTWLHPHGFVVEMPAEVDVKIFSTFAEVYVPLVQAVVGKLGSIPSSLERAEPSLFKDLTFGLGSEIPFVPISLIIRSAGGKVVKVNSLSSEITWQSR